jgi:hypothetical protein
MLRVAAILVSLLALASLAQPLVVEIRSTPTGFQLLRDGQPFFIKGAGGEGFETLAKAGGNSIRTWDSKNLQAVLDRAHAQKLAVTVGFWLPHERHGFNYDDAGAVVREQGRILATVKQFQNHPAVLLWAIGNEMEGDGNKIAIWKAVEAIAADIKRQDPYHPTMTVIAEIGGKKIPKLKAHCPSIDIIGVNSYAGMGSLGRRLSEAGWKKPFVVTEFGPPGHWESSQTSWGTKREMSSSQKADYYLARYREGVQKQSQCLGSYVFIWGHKQEATVTWYGMFLPDGTRLGAVDAMTTAWEGPSPANLCPEITAISASKVKGIPADSIIDVTLKVMDPEGDALRTEWRLVPETGIYSFGGDAEFAAPDAKNAILQSSTSHARVRAPQTGGAYRIYAYVRDGQGGGATANVPIQIAAPAGPKPLPKARLPFALGNPFYPSGYMGDQSAVRTSNTDGAMNVDIVKTGTWAGLVWQSPANDWGKRRGGLDFTGAKSLSFRARGAKGGERVTFGFGIIDSKAKYADSAKGELKNIALSAEWKTFRIPLEGKDLRQIKSGFYWVAATQNETIGFSLDGIRYE